MFSNKNKSQSSFIFFVVLSAVALFLAIFIALNLREERAPSCKACNVVIIDIDVLRADAIDCKERRSHTPNICKLFDESVVFTENISHSDNTRSGFVSGLTSLYPGSHGSWHKFFREIDSRVITLPTFFRENGYRTIYYGEVNDDQLIYEGFEKLYDSSKFDLAEIAKEQLAKEGRLLFYIFDGGIHYPYLLPGSHPLSKACVAPEGIPSNYENYIKELPSYIASRYKEVFKSKVIKSNPLLFDSPEENKDELYSLYLKLQSTKKQEVQTLKDVWRLKYELFLDHIDSNNPEHIDYVKCLYSQQVKDADSKLDGAIDTFFELNNSIVVLKSDHGDEFFEHGSYNHQNDLYQELIRTPLSFKIPSVKPKKIDGLSQDVDIFPTLVDLVGLESITQFQGKSLKPLIYGYLEKVNEYQIAQKGEGAAIASFRKGDWKLIIKDDNPIEVYNLLTDPNEKSNVIDTNYELATTLFEDYMRIVNSFPKYLNYDQPLLQYIDEEKRKRLIEEGYF